jgi:hypothetical protein
LKTRALRGFALRLLLFVSMAFGIIFFSTSINLFPPHTSHGLHIYSVCFN